MQTTKEESEKIIFNEVKRDKIIKVREYEILNVIAQQNNEVDIIEK